MVKNSKGQSGYRSFTVTDVVHKDGCPTKFSRKDYTGSFVSNQPAGAAKKALTSLCSVKRIKGQCTLFITVRETTQGKSGKTWSSIER